MENNGAKESAIGEEMEVVLRQKMEWKKKGAIVG